MEQNIWSLMEETETNGNENTYFAPNVMGITE
jgi:hypothetical protein